MSETWWKVRAAKTSTPEPIMVDKVDGDFVVLPAGSRHRIVATDWTGSNYFPTHKEAREFCIRRAERRVKVASGALTEAMFHLDMAREIPER